MEKNGRLMSLDALRGADMFFIIGFSSVVVSLCQLLGFGSDCWLATQMTHVVWHGFRHHDTIFPLFLFLAGVSWPFSYASQVAKGRTTSAILRKIFVRMAMLVFLGLATANFFAFKVSSFRYCSVLAHIGVCWAVAALLFMFVRSWRARIAIAIGLLAVHWATLFFFTAPDAAALLASTDPDIARRVASYAAYGTDGFSFTGNIAGWIDRALMPGHMHEVVFDPEGLFAKVSGTALAMMGTLAGELLRSKSVVGGRKAAFLACAGAAALVLTFILMPCCPVNKKLWTATFVLASAAYSFFMLAIFYWIVDVKGFRRWTFFFRVIGMNSITIYVMMRFMGFSAMSRFFLSGVAGLGGKEWASLVFGFGTIAVEWLVLLFLYRKNTFLKV